MSKDIIFMQNKNMRNFEKMNCVFALFRKLLCGERYQLVIIGDEVTP